MTTIEKLRNFENDLLTENKRLLAETESLRFRVDLEREITKKVIAERDKYFDELLVLKGL